MSNSMIDPYIPKSKLVVKPKEFYHTLHKTATQNAQEKALVKENTKQAAKETPETAAAAEAANQARITMERLIAAEEGKGQIERALQSGRLNPKAIG
jgi:hypothetical protein